GIQTASGHGIPGGPLGPQQVDGPAGLALDVATADRCDPIDPHACLLPFPNDHFVRADASTPTGKRLDLHPLSMPRNVAGKPIDPTEWNRNDGYSPGQLVVVKVPGISVEHTNLPPITRIEDSLAPDSAVTVLEIDPDGNRPPKRHPVWAELDATVDGQYGGGNVEGVQPPESPPLHDPDNGRALLIRPAVNWKEGHRYVVVLRSMKDATGAPIPENPVFAALSDDDKTVEDTLFAARKAHLDALVWPEIAAAHPAIERDEVWLAWDFTVASAENLAGRMLHMRDDAFASLDGAAPAFTVTSVEENVNGNLFRRIQGEFQVPRYVSTPTPGARMAYDPVTGQPMRQPTDQPATFTCLVPPPQYDENGDVVPTGLSVYGHGLLGGQDELNASVHAQFGNDFRWTYCATDWLGMTSEDLPTILALIVPDLSNFHLIPDRGQQGMLNFLFLSRLMSHPDGFAAHDAFRLDGQPLVDHDLVVYDGNSQGGIMGGGLTAVAQDFTRATLGVPGMNYSTLLRRSKDYEPFATLQYPFYADELDRSLVFSLIQILWDRAEANGYAHHMTDRPYPGTPEHRVLLHVGFGDHQVAQVTAEVEARTIGAAVHWPPPPRHTDDPPFALIDRLDEPGYEHAGSALMMWDSGTPAPPLENVPPTGGRDPHETPRRDSDAQRQKDHFFRFGTVIDVCTTSAYDRPDERWPIDGSCQATYRWDG
ncbi:MAG TPA: hypothetical protein VM618_10540, partial [Acidimicrobiia bacterium]|nr:hypothetical protein [Acidimicrobiia bacterium]